MHLNLSSKTRQLMHLYIYFRLEQTKLYDKEDDLNFPMVNFQSLSSPTSPAYGPIASQARTGQITTAHIHINSRLGDKWDLNLRLSLRRPMSVFRNTMQRLKVLTTCSLLELGSQARVLVISVLFCIDILALFVSIFSMIVWCATRPLRPEYERFQQLLVQLSKYQNLCRMLLSQMKVFTNFVWNVFKACNSGH